MQQWRGNRNPSPSGMPSPRGAYRTHGRNESGHGSHGTVMKNKNTRLTLPPILGREGHEGGILSIFLPQEIIRPKSSQTSENSSFSAGLTYILHATPKLISSLSAAGEMEACWNNLCAQHCKRFSSPIFMKIAAWQGCPPKQAAIVHLGKTTSKILVHGLCDYLRS